VKNEIRLSGDFLASFSAILALHRLSVLGLCTLVGSPIQRSTPAALKSSARKSPPLTTQGPRPGSHFTIGIFTDNQKPHQKRENFAFFWGSSNAPPGIPNRRKERTDFGFFAHSQG
jgi:hypothetical protein